MTTISGGINDSTTQIVSQAGDVKVGLLGWKNDCGLYGSTFKANAITNPTTIVYDRGRDLSTDGACPGPQDYQMDGDTRPRPMDSGVARPRRLRRGELVRGSVQDVHLNLQDIVFPIFVSGIASARPVASMPGISQLPVADTVRTVRSLAGRGLRQFILFGVTPPNKKDAGGSFAASPDAPVNRALSEIRHQGLEVVAFSDLCFCEYTDHGHCGVLIDGDRQWVVDNDATLERMASVAVAQAKAGADLVAPSGMMDGQVAAIRHALDGAGFHQVGILAYSVKYASNLYGPFREAGEGGMKFGDRSGYQMDFRRRLEWRTELETDIAEGADMVMVKPAISYLDIIHQVRQACSVPLAAFHVSGEFAMLHAAADRGWIELKPAVLEQTYAIKRAGADLVISYFAPQLLDWM